MINHKLHLMLIFVQTACMINTQTLDFHWSITVLVEMFLLFEISHQYVDMKTECVLIFVVLLFVGFGELCLYSS